MATKPGLMVMEDAPYGATRNPAQPICPERFSMIYTTHYRYVLGICHRFFRQREDAEDAAAEVFLKLYRVLHQKDERLPFRPWVAQVAWRHCIDKLRQRKRERSSSLEEADFESIPDRSISSPLSQLLQKDEHRQFREQLTRLPHRYKAPLMLLYYKRMSYSEVARALNTRLPALRTMIFRAKGYMRRNLHAEQCEQN
ncbi:MAG TPA: sigma-70 family RNA polymerase sigma factor [Candidatus Limnocylindrales bacterium]|nr:sigma-70 family RNA polymerase sigma factor [Candidatus Limnocylindrales bacterium]